MESIANNSGPHAFSGTCCEFQYELVIVILNDISMIPSSFSNS